MSLTLRNSNDVTTRKFAVQLVAAATEFAEARAPDVKSSETKNHGMEPAKKHEVNQSSNKQCASNRKTFSNNQSSVFFFCSCIYKEPNKENE